MKLKKNQRKKDLKNDQCQFGLLMTRVMRLKSLNPKIHEAQFLLSLISNDEIKKKKTQI